MGKRSISSGDTGDEPTGDVVVGEPVEPRWTEAEPTNIPAPEAFEPAPAPEPAPEPLPLVTLTVFCQVKHIRRDQGAGFANWAMRNKLTHQTVPQWEVSWAEFMGTPIK